MAQIDLDIVVNADDGLSAVSELIDLLEELQGAADVDFSGLSTGIEDVAKSTEGLDDSSAGASSSVGGMAVELEAAAEIAGRVVGALKAIVGALVSLAEHAIAANDFRGDLEDLYGVLLQDSEAGYRFYTEMDALAATLPKSAKDVQELSQQLLAAGLSADRMADTIRTLTTVQVALGKGGAQAADKIKNTIDKALALGKFTLEAKNLRGTGVSIDAVVAQIAKDTGKSLDEVKRELDAGKVAVGTGIDALNKVVAAKFGDIAGRQMLDLDTQITKLKDSFRTLFEGADPGELLKGLKEIADVFSVATPAGKALQFVITQLMNALFGVGAQGAPLVAKVLKGLIIIMLQAYIMTIPWIRKIGDLTKQFLDWAKGSSVVSSVLKGLLVVGVALGVLIAAITVGLGAFVTAVVAPFVAIGTIIAVVGGKIMEKVGDIKKAVEDFFNAPGTLLEKFVKLGSDIVDGIIKGLTDGAKRLGDAVKNLGSDALKGVKSTLGIASPSKEFAKVGRFAGEGFALGMESASPTINAVTESVAGGSMASAGQGATASGGRGGVTVNLTVNVSGSGSSADEIAEILPSVITDVFEQLAMSGGALSGV